MEYFEVYETTDRFDFYRAVDYLEAHHIEVQKLYEYRLYAETNFGAEGTPAILRVSEYYFSKAYRLLMEGGFIKKDWRQNKPVELKNHSFWNKVLYKDEIQKIRGNKIKKVTYILANEIDYDLDAIHSVDYGIGIQFENDMVLWWTFEEEDPFLESDYFLPCRYELQFQNIRYSAGEGYNIIDVSKNEYWAQLIAEPIKDIKIYCQAFKTYTIVTDLLIETHSKRVAIFSTGEPTEHEDQIEVHLFIDNEWTIVAFDEEVIKASNRIHD